MRFALLGPAPLNDKTFRSQYRMFLYSNVEILRHDTVQSHARVMVVEASWRNHQMTHFFLVAGLLIIVGYAAVYFGFRYFFPPEGKR
jgi:hypothetical protein